MQQITRRKQIQALLLKQEMSAKQLADYFDVDVRDIIEDLNHIAKSIKPKKLKIIPAQCKACNFIFKERTKLKTTKFHSSVIGG